MDWLNRLFKPSARGAAEDPNAVWLYVQCGRCGTPLAVRVDRRNELTPDYESGGYHLRKEMMDSKCFQLMHGEMHFDAQGRVTSKNLDQGNFLTREEYEALRQKMG